ncbi:hypothetical protein HDU86_005251 [Geranomyces michiganensis]|nr:hypothetical protein HDU86_005251 [Geranomyces michiganensis]
MSTASPDDHGSTSSPHPQPTRPIDATKGLALFLNKRIPGQKLWASRVAPVIEPEPITATVEEIQPQSKIPPVSRLPVAKARVKPPPSRDELQRAANAVQQWRTFVRRAEMARKGPVLDQRWTLRSAFRQWRKAYRSRHVEWRMEVKADVHLQYARSGRALRIWQLYVEQRRNKAMERENVTQIASNFLMRRTWAVWRSRISDLYSVRAAELKAEQCGERNSIRTAFQTWRGARNRRVMESTALKCAVQTYNRAFTGKCLHRWQTRLQARMLAGQKTRIAEEFERRRKHKLAFSAWRAFVASRQLREHQFQAGLVLRNRHLAALMLRRWLAKNRNARLEADLERRGADHYHAVVVKKCLAAWRERSAIMAAARMMTVKLQTELDRALLLRILHSWKGLLRDIARAEKQFIYMLQKRNLSRWRRQAALRIRSRELLEVKAGVEHFGRRITAITFAEWKGFVHWQRTQRFLLRDADIFAVRVRTARHFRAWRRALAAAVDDRMKANRGRALHDDLVLSRTLHILRVYARDRISERENLALAIRHRNRYIARKALRAWWSYADEASQRMAMWRTAVHHAYHARIARVWVLWRMKAASRHAARVKWRMAGVHADRVAAKNCLAGWRAVIKARESFRTLFREFAMRHYGELLRGVFNLWCARLQERRDDKLEALRIQSWRIRRIAIKSLAKWREYVKSKVWQRKYDQTILAQAASVLEAIRLRSALKTWITRLRVKKLTAAMAGRADAFRTRGQLTDAFGVWRCLRAHRRWERKSARKAAKFRRAIVIRSTFSHWHSLRTDWSAIYTARVAAPIAFWGLKVSRKAFDGWRKHAASKRELRERVRDAMGWKTENALRDVAAQFLKCAQKERANREARALMDIGKRGADELKRVHPFALKWRAKTLVGREKRKKADADRQTELLRQLRNEELLGQIAANVAQRFALPLQPKLEQDSYSRSWTSKPQNDRSRSSPKRHRPPPRAPAFLALAAKNSVPYSVFFNATATQSLTRERSTSAQPVAAHHHLYEQARPPLAQTERTRVEQPSRPLRFDDLLYQTTQNPACGLTMTDMWARNENGIHESFPPAPTPPHNHQQETCVDSGPSYQR